MRCMPLPVYGASISRIIDGMHAAGWHFSQLGMDCIRDYSGYVGMQACLFPLAAELSMVFYSRV